MNTKYKRMLINFILPVILIIIGFRQNALLGVLIFLLYIGILLFINRASIFSYIGVINYSRRNMDKALLWFERAYKTGKAKPKTLVSYAYLLLKSGNVSKSEDILKSVLGQKLEDDDRYYAKSNLALVIWKKGELDKAVEMLEDVLNNYKTTTVYGSLGYLLILKGNLDRALEFNLEAYEYNSANAVILDNLGQTYYLKGDLEKALEVYEKLMGLNPSFPEAYYNYGLVLLKKGEIQKALDSFEKSLNYNLTFLSTVTRDEIELKIEEAKRLL